MNTKTERIIARIEQRTVVGKCTKGNMDCCRFKWLYIAVYVIYQTMKTPWNDCIDNFYRTLSVQCALPEGIRALYPWNESKEVASMMRMFYDKYYSDNNSRRLILGINPGRLGAGATGIPFTDTKRLLEICGIQGMTTHTHEPSSVFVYEVIEAYGGPNLFYNDFYFSSVCPVGFIRDTDKGQVNFNYYYDALFAKELIPELVNWLTQQISWGLRNDRVIVFGTGENLKFMTSLNSKYALFDEIIALEHPRYIMQYKLRQKQDYIEKYLRVLAE
jgi:Domain of unknown function (DUF4918)